MTSCGHGLSAWLVDTMAMKSDDIWWGEAPEEQCSEAQADRKAVSEKAPRGWQVPAPSWNEDSVLLGDKRHKLFVRIRTKSGSQNGSHASELGMGCILGDRVGSQWLDDHMETQWSVQTTIVKISLAGRQWGKYEFGLWKGEVKKSMIGTGQWGEGQQILEERICTWIKAY